METIDVTEATVRGQQKSTGSALLECRRARQRHRGEAARTAPAPGYGKRGNEARSEGERISPVATVVVPESIRSAPAVRLLAAYVQRLFLVGIEERGQVRMITVRREQREKLMYVLREFAQCFC